jgi:hypothetical protein
LTGIANPWIFDQHGNAKDGSKGERLEEGASSHCVYKPKEAALSFHLDTALPCGSHEKGDTPLSTIIINNSHFVEAGR